MAAEEMNKILVLIDTFEGKDIDLLASLDGKIDSHIETFKKIFKKFLATEEVSNKYRESRKTLNTPGLNPSLKTQPFNELMDNFKDVEIKGNLEEEEKKKVLALFEAILEFYEGTTDEEKFKKLQEHVDKIKELNDESTGASEDVQEGQMNKILEIIHKFGNEEVKTFQRILEGFSEVIAEKYITGRNNFTKELEKDEDDDDYDIKKPFDEIMDNFKNTTIKEDLEEEEKNKKFLLLFLFEAILEFYEGTTDEEKFKKLQEHVDKINKELNDESTGASEDESKNIYNEGDRCYRVTNDPDGRSVKVRLMGLCNSKYNEKEDGENLNWWKKQTIEEKRKIVETFKKEQNFGPILEELKQNKRFRDQYRKEGGRKRKSRRKSKRKLRRKSKRKLRRKNRKSRRKNRKSRRKSIKR